MGGGDFDVQRWGEGLRGWSNLLPPGGSLYTGTKWRREYTFTKVTRIFIVKLERA